jgi:hypothetical protein
VSSYGWCAKQRNLKKYFRRFAARSVKRLRRFCGAFLQKSDILVALPDGFHATLSRGVQPIRRYFAFLACLRDSSGYHE